MKANSEDDQRDNELDFEQKLNLNLDSITEPSMTLYLSAEAIKNRNTLHVYKSIISFYQQKRVVINETMNQILNKLKLDLASITEPSMTLSAEASKNYVRSIDAFSSTCFNINEVS